MARHIGLVSPVRPCCAETHANHASHESHDAILYSDLLGETAPCARRISTSQIFVIFYGIKTLNTVSLVVIAAL